VAALWRVIDFWWDGFLHASQGVAFILQVSSLLGVLSRQWTITGTLSVSAVSSAMWHLLTWVLWRMLAGKTEQELWKFYQYVTDTIVRCWEWSLGCTLQGKAWKGTEALRNSLLGDGKWNEEQSSSSDETCRKQKLRF